MKNTWREASGTDGHHSVAAAWFAPENVFHTHTEASSHQSWYESSYESSYKSSYESSYESSHESSYESSHEPSKTGLWPFVCEGWAPAYFLRNSQEDIHGYPTYVQHGYPASICSEVATQLAHYTPPSSQRKEAHMPCEDLRLAAITMNVEPEALLVTRRSDGTLQVSLRAGKLKK